MFPRGLGEHVMEVLSIIILQCTAHEIAIGPALRALEKPLQVTDCMSVLMVGLRSENLAEPQQEPRERCCTVPQNGS
jgi:hypothetical protein